MSSVAARIGALRVKETFINTLSTSATLNYTSSGIINIIYKDQKPNPFSKELSYQV